MSFRLSFEAEEDIIAIAQESVRLFGSAQAGRYHDGLFSVFELIAANPQMTRERHEIAPPVRIYPFKAHLVIYRIEESEIVFIVRVRHGHEDWSTDPS